MSIPIEDNFKTPSHCFNAGEFLHPSSQIWSFLLKIRNNTENLSWKPKEQHLTEVIKNDHNMHGKATFASGVLWMTRALAQKEKLSISNANIRNSTPCQLTQKTDLPWCHSFGGWKKVFRRIQLLRSIVNFLLWRSAWSACLCQIKSWEAVTCKTCFSTLLLFCHIWYSPLQQLTGDQRASKDHKQFRNTQHKTISQTTNKSSTKIVK